MLVFLENIINNWSMSNTAPTQEVADAIAEEAEITCCLDIVGAEDADCALVAMRTESAPGPALTVKKIIEICQAETETPVVISHESLRDQVPGDTRASKSQRVTAAFRFLTELGGVTRRDSKENGIEQEIELPLLAAGCRAAQLAHQEAKKTKTAGGSKKHSTRIPGHLSKVDVDAVSLGSFEGLLGSNVPDEDFVEAANALLEKTIARTGSKATAYTAAQRAVKAIINTPGYGRDNKAARRVAQLSEAMRILTAQKGAPKQE